MTGEESDGLFVVMAVPGHDPGISPAIHVVLQERFQQPRSEAGRDPAWFSAAAATWMAGTSPGHDPGISAAIHVVLQA